MRKIVWIMMSLGLLIPCNALPVLAGDFVGIVKSVKGSAIIERNSKPIAAMQGMELSQGDVVKTDQHSAIALVFSDDTLISMGPTTKVAIDEYVFKPLEKRMAFVTRVIHGTISFLSGQLEKLAPKSVQLILPTATIGVRGTHVLIKVD